MGMYGAAALAVLRDIRESANKKTKPMTFEGKIIAFVLLIIAISIIGVFLVDQGKEAAGEKQKKEAAQKAQAAEEKRSAVPVMRVSLSDRYEIALPDDTELISEEKKDRMVIRCYSFKDKFSAYDDHEEIDKVYKCEFSLTVETGKTDEDLETAVYDKYAGKNGNLCETDINGEEMFIFEGKGKDGYCWKDSAGTIYALELSGKYFHEYQDDFLEMISEK